MTVASIPTKETLLLLTLAIFTLAVANDASGEVVEVRLTDGKDDRRTASAHGRRTSLAAVRQRSNRDSSFDRVGKNRVCEH